MSPALVVAIALGLAMDAFAVSMACSASLSSVKPRQVFRIAFHFGWFQAMMPVLGWLGGSGARPLIEGWDHWVAFGLLAFVGGKALLQALGGGEGCCGAKGDPTRGWSLVAFSLATSVDALAVGISLSAIGASIWGPAATIGGVTAFLSCLGMLIGSRASARFGRPIEILGGLVLLGIGMRVLADHL
ncbi:MAG: manganese efflux pump MntP family protein [Fimbriimonadales bacterium]|nr:manganese efflux pump MntP family protein [Fimbriimonadales bacterium]